MGSCYQEGIQFIHRSLGGAWCVCGVSDSDLVPWNPSLVVGTYLPERWLWLYLKIQTDQRKDKYLNHHLQTSHASWTRTSKTNKRVYVISSCCKSLPVNYCNSYIMTIKCFIGWFLISGCRSIVLHVLNCNVWSYLLSSPAGDTQ